MSDTIVRLEEARLRVRAYFLWEREGRPHGRAEEHWRRAAEAEAAAAAAAMQAGHEAPRAQGRKASGAAAAATPSSAGAPVARRRAAVRVGAAEGEACTPAGAAREQAGSPPAECAARRGATTVRPRKAGATARASRRQ
jgi:hypothetical protein